MSDKGNEYFSRWNKKSEKLQKKISAKLSQTSYSTYSQNQLLGKVTYVIPSFLYSLYSPVILSLR